jgi:hypothetical protein
MDRPDELNVDERGRRDRLEDVGFALKHSVDEDRRADATARSLHSASR